MKIKDRDILIFRGRLLSSILLENQRTKKQIVLSCSNKTFNENEPLQVELWNTGEIWLIGENTKLRVEDNK